MRRIALRPRNNEDPGDQLINAYLQWRFSSVCVLLERPDEQRPSRLGGNPDYLFRVPSGRLVTVERTQIIAPGLRRLARFSERELLPGIRFALPDARSFELRVDIERLDRYMLTTSLVEEAIRELTDRTTGGHPLKFVALAPGVNLYDRLGTPPGFNMVVTAPEAPSCWSQELHKQTRCQLEGALGEAGTKFAGFKKPRILVIDVSQAGVSLPDLLDAEGLWQTSLSFDELWADLDEIAVYIGLQRWWPTGSQNRRVLNVSADYSANRWVVYSKGKVEYSQ